MTDQPEPDALFERLKAYVSGGAHRAAAADDAFVQDCLQEAAALVGQLIGAATNVPTQISERAIIEAGSELFHRKQAPNGISQFAAPDGGQLRIGKDPMVVARTILAPFLPLGFA